MSLICISGHQGTGKSTILKELVKLGYKAYGLDEEKVAGYFNLKNNSASINVPQGLERNLEWRKDNVWKVDIKKISKLATAISDKPTFYFGYATNIEELWDICDDIIVLELSDETTKERLLNRTNNSFGKHPGEIALAIENSKTMKEKAKSYSTHQIHYIDASLDIVSISSIVEGIGLESSKFVH